MCPKLRLMLVPSEQGHAHVFQMCCGAQIIRCLSCRLGLCPLGLTLQVMPFQELLMSNLV